MKNLKGVLVLLLTFLLFNVSCSSSDSEPESFCEDYVLNIQEATQNYSNAAMAQYDNPTDATCTTLKQAIQDLIDIVEDAKECIPDSEIDSYNELIAELKQHLLTACD
jgi:hypothetical protein